MQKTIWYSLAAMFFVVLSCSNDLPQPATKPIIDTTPQPPLPITIKILDSVAIGTIEERLNVSVTYDTNLFYVHHYDTNGMFINTSIIDTSSIEPLSQIQRFDIVARPDLYAVRGDSTYQGLTIRYTYVNNRQTKRIITSTTTYSNGNVSTSEQVNQFEYDTNRNPKSLYSYLRVYGYVTNSSGQQEWRDNTYNKSTLSIINYYTIHSVSN